MVDIKSKILKEALTKVMGDVKGISLAEVTPTIELIIKEGRRRGNELQPFEVRLAPEQSKS